MAARSDVTRRAFSRRLLIVALLAPWLPRRLRAAICRDTTADILGPYYVPNAPSRTRLATPDEPGQRLFISGVVRADDCRTPVPDTLIEIWQANDAGCYSISQPCVGGDPTADAFNLRASIASGPRGEFAFETILPGHYTLGSTRPRHIHFRFSAPDGTVLVTQLYFDGDPFIDTDPWASNAPERVIPLREADSALHGVFDVDLLVDPTTVPEPGKGTLGSVALGALALLRRRAKAARPDG